VARTRRWGAVALLVVLTGCSGETDAPAPPPAAVHEHWAGCDTTSAFRDAWGPNQTPGVGGIPNAFIPVTAVLCFVGERPGKKAGAAPVAVDLERRATEIQPLLTYLARPSRMSHDPELACQAMAWSPPWLFLLDADGRWVHPQVPTDPCGFALDQFTERELPWLSLPYTDTVVRVRAGG